MRTILIQIDEEGRIEVRENGRTTGQLSWDEMIGQIAEMVHPRIGPAGRYPMMTDEQWEARWISKFGARNQSEAESKIVVEASRG